MAWALVIEDDETRESSLVGLLRQWRRLDAEAADRWIDGSSLTPELVARARAAAPAAPARRGAADEEEAAG